MTARYRAEAQCLRVGAVLVFLASSSYAQAGPDVVTGHLYVLQQLAREGAIGSGTLGLGLYTTSCNPGDIGIPIDPLPETNHPAMFGNMIRLETVNGATRLEQIGQSWFKHSFGSSNDDECGNGCPNGGFFNEVAAGCSDTYAAIQFDACGLGGSTQGLLGPRSAIHPYTGAIIPGPNLGSGGGCPINFPAANHTNHNHPINQFGLVANTDISHRLQVSEADLSPILHPGGRYFQEGGYITGSEYLLANGAQYNNYAYREVGIVGPDGTGFYEFPNLSGTFAESSAMDAWPGAGQTILEHAPLGDGRGILGYQVTDLGGGTWHYEYAMQNLHNDASFGSISIPVPSGVTITNIGFHAPLNHTPEPDADNYDNIPWAATVAGGAISWSTESFSVNPMANAVRWGTLYNFRFDADTPPQGVFATVGMFKMPLSIPAATLGPQAPGQSDCNNNGINDTCELDCNAAGCSGVKGCGTATDCDGTGVPDDCEIDCNGNGIHDGCDIGTVSADCTGNGIPDECEADCDEDGLPDSCEIKNGTGEDCNGDGLLDNCTVVGGPDDLNGNGTPDVCECAAPAAPEPPAGSAIRNRYLLISGALGTITRIQVTVLSTPPGYSQLIGNSWWVTGLRETSEDSGNVDPVEGEPTFKVATLGCDPDNINWFDFETIEVADPAIVPGATYQVVAFTASCPPNQVAAPSVSATISTSIWGDIVKDCTGVPCGPPDGSVDVTTDVTGILDKFKNAPNAPSKARADIEPAWPDLLINITDVTFGLNAFMSDPYSFETATPCSASD